MPVSRDTSVALGAGVTAAKDPERHHGRPHTGVGGEAAVINDGVDARPRRERGQTRKQVQRFGSDTHARDLVVHVEPALDVDGTFLAYRARNTSNVGAHTVSFIPLAQGVGISTSVSHVPAASLRGAPC